MVQLIWLTYLDHKDAEAEELLYKTSLKYRIQKESRRFYFRCRARVVDNLGPYYQKLEKLLEPLLQRMYRSALRAKVHTLLVLGRPFHSYHGPSKDMDVLSIAELKHEVEARGKSTFHAIERNDLVQLLFGSADQTIAEVAV